MKKLVYGVGLNDSKEIAQTTINGEKVTCPYYRTWVNMLARCYSASYQKRHPTYVGCTVSPEWLVFSTFRAWMLHQHWRGKALDKDLLIQGNKVYSPNTCVFVDQTINSFMNDNGAKRGQWSIGVYYQKQSQKFMAQCRNPLTGKRDYLGLHDYPEKAHQAWLKRKQELQVQLADTITDVRIKTALLNYNFV